MLVCVMGFQGTEVGLGQSDHPLFLVCLRPQQDRPFSPGLLGLLILSRSWAYDCVSAALSVLSGAHSSPPPVIPFWVWVSSPLGDYSHTVLAGAWSGFPWSPICVVRAKGPGLVPPVLYHPVQTCSAPCLSMMMPPAWSTHLAAALTPLWLNSLFSHHGLGSLPCLQVLGSGRERPMEQMIQTLLFSFSRLITRPHHPPSPSEKE